MTSVFPSSRAAVGVPAQAADEAVAGERSYYNISQAAALLGVSRVSIWRWIRAGHLPASRLGHRTTRIKREDLERLLVQVGPAGARSWAGTDVANGHDRTVGTVAGSNGDGAGAPFPGRHQAGESEHFAQFYEADAYLLDAVSEFIGAALLAGDAGVVVATPAHREGIDERLHAAGVNVFATRAGGQYVALDAAETLSHFMVDGAPDPARFQEVVGGIVARAGEGGRRVRVFGEMVALLVEAGNDAAAIRLETLWNDLQQTHSFTLFCAYPMDQLGGEALAGFLGDVCAAHTRVIPAESYSGLADGDDRLRAITMLQQKAQSLEAEIGARKQTEERLAAALAAERAAREAAEAALRFRDEFLSIAAHELKTPVTGLSGYAQLLLRRFNRDGDFDAEYVAEALQAITGQAGKLSRLLNQLLDISRLEARKLTLERQPVDLTALVEQVVAGAQAWSARHTITLDTAGAPACLEARVDPLRIEQVLTNLLDNAVKYSPNGGPIEVSLTLRPARDAQADWVGLSVRDHGLGIPAEKRGQIFERFYQAHGNGHKSGLGLGLYISRQIVELHGGEIRAEFPPDGGTRFVVRLPVEPATSPAA